LCFKVKKSLVKVKQKREKVKFKMTEPKHFVAEVRHDSQELSVVYHAVASVRSVGTVAVGVEEVRVFA
jgi:hypothetical protein